MQLSAQLLLTIGLILLVALFLSTIARRTILPRVTLLLLFGICIGHSGLDLIPDVFTDHFDVIADMTLLMIGFLLGGKLTKRAVRESALSVLIIAVTAALLTSLLVALGLYLVGVYLPVAILLGAIASATAPAAIFDVVNEKHFHGRFTRLLLSIVALDDVVALILFAMSIAFVKTINGNAGSDSFLWLAIYEIFGAALLGILVGIPATYLTGRVRKGQPILPEAVGLVFVCGGLAIYLEVSFLISSMVMGAVIANLAKHHDYPFHAIEGIESLFMIVFFVLAGASLDLSAIADLGIVGVTFIICRVLGKYLGAFLGGQASGASLQEKRWLGLAMLTQAGVPVGMALVAANQFPEYRQVLLSIVISSTVIFELVGPVLTRIALQKASEKGRLG